MVKIFHALKPIYIVLEVMSKEQNASIIYDAFKTHKTCKYIAIH